MMGLILLASIETVTVFADRADVTHRAQAKCRDGAAVVEVTGIPSTAFEQTLRAHALGSARAIGVASRLSAEPVEGATAAEEKARAQELEVLRQRERVLADRAEALKVELQRLEAFEALFVADASASLGTRKADAAAWTRAMDTFLEKRRAIRREKTAVETEKSRISSALDARPPKADETVTRTARVTVECGESEVEVRVSYVVPGARWVPEYDFHFVPGGPEPVGEGRGELIVSATIQQSTGEDWGGVELYLSTARPRGGAEAPYPEAPSLAAVNRVEKSERVVVQSLSDRGSLTSGPGGGFDDLMPIETQPTVSPFEDRGRSFVLKVPHRTTIRADGRPYWLPVESLSTKASVSLVAVPKLRRDVFRVAKLNNPATHSLLPGRVRSYRGESLIGVTDLPFAGAGERMEISLGFDDELRVTRTRVEANELPPGLLGSASRRLRVFRIGIVSQSASTRNIEIRENVPVSEVEEITVELLKQTTVGYDLDAARGFVSWQRTVPARQRQELTFGYAIELPDHWTFPSE